MRLKKHPANYRFDRSTLLVFRILLITALIWSFPAGAAAGSALDQMTASMTKSLGFTPEISIHNNTGLLNFLAASKGNSIQVSSGGTGIENTGRAFFTQYGSYFGIKDQSAELQVIKTTSADNGAQFVRFQQVYNDIPIFGGEVIVQGDGEGAVLSVNGEISPSSGMDTTPLVAAADAMNTAVKATAFWRGVDESRLSAGKPELWIYNPALMINAASINYLVWRVEVEALDGAPVRELVLVNAKNGQISLHFNQVAFALNRLVYDLDNVAISTDSLPGPDSALVCSDENSGCQTGSSDDAQMAYEYVGNTYNFYANFHGRDSVDDNGMTLINTVRLCLEGDDYECPYQNAFWSGTQMAYGDGLVALDVVGHELTHGVTQYTSALFYYAQSGAINEAFSDIWGEFIDQTYTVDKPEADRWLIGENLPASFLEDYTALRSMKNPGSSEVMAQCPDKVSSDLYWCKTTDQAGVHTNLGVFAKAAYLMTDGDTFNGYEVSGIGLTKTAKIFYYVQTNLMTSGADFLDLYNALNTACYNLTGTDDITENDCIQTTRALKAVEAEQLPTECPVTRADMCTSGTVSAVFSDGLEAGSSNWTSSGDVWELAGPYTALSFAKTGEYNLAANFPSNTVESALSLAQDIELPEAAYLYFDHAYMFHARDDVVYAGGVIEYSLDSGQTWQDAGDLFTDGGYNGTVGEQDDSNPLAGQSAFVKISYGYTTAKLDLSSLEGQSVRFRFRIGSDNIDNEYSYWFIDNVNVYSCDQDSITTTLSEPDSTNGCFLKNLR